VTVALIVAGIVVVIAAVVAGFMERRRPDPPTQPELEAPVQVDRQDFPRPEAPWLVALFSSRTCDACVAMRPKVDVLASDDVVVVDIDWAVAPELHERYRVPGVPMTLIVDAEGVVQRSFFSAATATDLWAAVAEVREPGSTPMYDDGCADEQSAPSS
jgi:hypothetical protein